MGPNAERGFALAEQLCRGCHIVSPKQTSSAGAGIPSFRAIANKPEQTSAHIANVLIKPHAPMPNMQLSRFEILDIIAYLDGLRRPDAGAPLLKPSKGGAKPKYPRRS
ncbi:MAG: cytochrome c [Pseudomonadota bacterium]